MHDRLLLFRHSNTVFDVIAFAADEKRFFDVSDAVTMFLNWESKWQTRG